MSDKSNVTQNKIIFYQTEDNKVSISVRIENDTIWLTQKQMAELFECSTDNISLHLKKLYSNKEIRKDATTEESSVVQTENSREVTRKVTFYNLEAIISVGYRVNFDFDQLLELSRK